jgi:hypothetical protein
MTTVIQPSYVPALRMKAGELTGLRDLAPDVADRVLPRLIVPPRQERDETLQIQPYDLLVQTPRTRGGDAPPSRLRPRNSRPLAT